MPIEAGKGNPSPSAWGTQNELAWLQNIGQSWEHNNGPMPDKHDLLRGYRAVMAPRWRWGNIDRFAVMKCLHEVLNDDETTV